MRQRGNAPVELPLNSFRQLSYLFNKVIQDKLRTYIRPLYDEHHIVPGPK